MKISEIAMRQDGDLLSQILHQGRYWFWDAALGDGWIVDFVADRDPEPGDVRFFTTEAGYVPFVAVTVARYDRPIPGSKAVGIVRFRAYSE